MDTVLLFALPLVGGLIFSSNWNATRWTVAREEGHRLYFRAVFFGAVIFALVTFVRWEAADLWAGYARLEERFQSYLEPLAKDPASAPAVAELAITCFLSMLAGWPLAKVLNLAFRRDYWLRRAIGKNDFEAFLLDAADREFPIAATMDDAKVYVGYVVHSFDPALARRYILLLPLMSGYRDAEAHRVHFTTFYLELYGSGSVAGAEQSRALPPPLEHLRAEDFTTLLPVERIVSCRLFDPEAYRAFQKAIAPPRAGAEDARPQPQDGPAAEPQWSRTALVVAALLAAVGRRRRRRAAEREQDQRRA